MWAHSSSCDPEAGGANGHVAGFPCWAWPDSKAPWPPPHWPSFQRCLWECRPGQNPGPFLLPLRACGASEVPGERVIKMGRLPSPQLAELHREAWACLSSVTQDQKAPRPVGVLVPGTSVPIEENGCSFAV